MDEPANNPLPQDQPNDPSKGPDEREAIPLEPLAPTAEGEPASRPNRPPLARPSVLELKDDTCPNCRAPLDADAVVCMKCGYDLQANRVLKPETGVDEIEPPPTLPDFIKPGGSPKVLLIAGACVTLAAMVTAAATNRTPSLSAGLAFAVLTLYRTILHTGTGLVGLWCAAYYVGHRLNRIELAVSRMFLALSILQLLLAAHLPIERPFLEGLARWPLALACYWLALFILFRRTRQETMLIALFHLAAYLFVELGVQLATWLEPSVAVTPGAGR